MRLWIAATDADHTGQWTDTAGNPLTYFNWWTATDGRTETDDAERRINEHCAYKLYTSGEHQRIGPWGITNCDGSNRNIGCQLCQYGESMQKC